MSCWICTNQLTDYILLPEKEDIFETPKIKNTYEVKTVDQFVFLYYKLCNPCLTMYLDNYPFDFNKLMKREIGK